MDKKRRQELLDQYANRKQPTGVFAVRNSASGEAWVGHSKNLDVQQNGLWGRLKSGMCDRIRRQRFFLVGNRDGHQPVP